MGKGVKKDALANSGKANNLSDQANTNATSLYKTVNPVLTQEATNPHGFDPKDLSAMDTASEQSIGGATAGAVGEGNLEAARTRNSGGFQPAAAESARAGMRQNSTNAVTIQGNNALQKERERQAGISGLTSLYGSNSAQALSALGLSNESLDVANHTQPSAWQQFGNTVLQNTANNLTKGPTSGFGEATGIGG